jgi:anti-anti-sigma regulatory factor
MAVWSRREASPAAGQIVCLRLTGQLCADTADALGNAVRTRLRTIPSARTVVLDLSGTPVIDDGARAALLSLYDMLARSHARLWLVLPEGEARAALRNNGAADALGQDALHTSLRAALLAAHAALPGPALVTSAMRTLLGQQPEILPLPGLPPRRRSAR